MNNDVSSLVNFFLEKNYIKSCDAIYCTNQIGAFLNTDFEYNAQSSANLYDSLINIIDYAVENNIIEDFLYQREILEAKITNIFIDKPSIVQETFESMNIDQAYKNFYNQCVETNYIKKNDLKRNIHFIKTVEDKPIEISINLARPEKNPKEIEKLKGSVSTGYPKCQICIENVGFGGNAKNAARSNHRVIEFKLNNVDYFFQYSPYLYYDFHCILIEKLHQDMHITDETIKVEVDFVDKFEDFFVGCNAGLPIVGASILNHNHFQGGIYTFPISSSKTVYKTISNNVEVEYLDWYLTTLKFISSSKQDIINEVNRVKNNWLNYSNSNINIPSSSNNSVNIITKKNNGVYEVLLILRNNLTNEEYPDGVYHPSSDYFHIKKENIGLIEAMGLAILPGRLKDELDSVKQYIINNKNIDESIHYQWAKQIKENYNNEDIEEYIHFELAKRFVSILKCCDVLKYSENKVDIIKEVIQ